MLQNTIFFTTDARNIGAKDDKLMHLCLNFHELAISNANVK